MNTSPRAVLPSQRDAVPGAGSQERRRRSGGSAWPWVAAGIAVTLVGLAAAYAYLPGGSVPSPQTRPIEVVVLPFRSLDDNSADTATAAGLQRAVIAQLRQLGGGKLDVVAGPQGATAAVERSGWTVRGTLQRGEGRVHISVDLVRMRDGRSSWSERYEPSIEDFPAARGELADRIAAAVAQRLELSGEEGGDPRFPRGVPEPEAASLI